MMIPVNWSYAYTGVLHILAKNIEINLSLLGVVGVSISKV